MVLVEFLFFILVVIAGLFCLILLTWWIISSHLTGRRISRLRRGSNATATSSI